MQQELIYRLSLTMVPNIGDVQAKALVAQFGSATAIFQARKSELQTVEGMGYVRAKAIKDFHAFGDAEKEISFIEKYRITPLFLTDSAYPKRLSNCCDSPTILYYKGNADLNTSKVVAVVGTRNHDEYGKMICEQMISEFALENVLICSGLAYGIDTIAHKAAVKENLHTIAVLAHGLDRIYPGQNRSLARQIVQNGGLLTDFRSNTNPDKQNFPKRNRIVAGMSDAVLVIQTGKRGGSLITADLANGYNRDVFTIPGRITDTRSEGCNFLISANKATLVSSADELLENMGWKEWKKPVQKKQRELFIEVTDDERRVVEILRENKSMQIDEIFFKSGLSTSALASALLTLEMQGLVKSEPGKMYSLE